MTEVAFGRTKPSVLKEERNLQSSSCMAPRQVSAAIGRQSGGAFGSATVNDLPRGSQQAKDCARKGGIISKADPRGYSPTDHTEITKMIGGGFLLNQSFSTKINENGKEELSTRCFMGRLTLTVV